MELVAAMGKWSSVHWRTHWEWKEGPQMFPPTDDRLGHSNLLTSILCWLRVSKLLPNLTAEKWRDKRRVPGWGLSSCIDVSSQPPLKHEWTRSMWCREQKSRKRATSGFSTQYIFLPPTWAACLRVFLPWQTSRTWLLNSSRHGTPLQYSCLENPTDRGDW